ncbi:MAG: hypothetical protein M1834_009569 [Cirrosporium novae-zelandiae]|nr:MAG: hypothetical protein M1834_009569 [Cirrosporium novae-zelandiae]
MYTLALLVALLPACLAFPTPTVLQERNVTLEERLATLEKRSSGKRGLAYNDVSLLSGFESSSYISWAYNWDSTTDTLPDSAWEYVPMLWGTAATHTTNWAARASAAIASGTTHLLGFNEPDLSTQADMTYSEAVTAWNTYMEPFSGKASLVSPCVTNGASPMGLTWLGNFLDACTDCTISAIAIHWYDSATNFAYFKEYINEAITLAGDKNVWLTEFGATGTDAEIASFLEEAISFLSVTDKVTYYAYYMVADGYLIDGTSVSSPVGTTYRDYVP